MKHDYTSFIDALPHNRCQETTTEKYMFIDTRKVVQDMLDLGYEVASFRRPKARTHAGRYSVHEVDFRRPQDMATRADQAPRVLFINSYDGSKRAQFIAGLIRFACSNGLVIGDLIQHQKFLHLGDHADAIIEGLKIVANDTAKAFDAIEKYKSINPTKAALREMAKRAHAIRYPDEEKRPVADLDDLLQVRREEDLRPNLWVKWNVVQENILKGGIPMRNVNGQVRLSGPVGNIEKSNDINQSLWNLLDEFAAA
jgi:Domain of unknown function (DUF932)